MHILTFLQKLFTILVSSLLKSIILRWASFSSEITFLLVAWFLGDSFGVYVDAKLLFGVLVWLTWFFLSNSFLLLLINYFSLILHRLLTISSWSIRNLFHWVHVHFVRIRIPPKMVAFSTTRTSVLTLSFRFSEFDIAGKITECRRYYHIVVIIIL